MHFCPLKLLGVCATRCPCVYNRVRNQKRLLHRNFLCPPLGLGKNLVVVVNGALMDNHQEELAEALAQRNYLRATSPEGLADTLIGLDESPSAWTPYPRAKPEAFAAVVDEEMCAAQEDR